MIWKKRRQVRKEIATLDLNGELNGSPPLFKPNFDAPAPNVTALGDEVFVVR